MSSVPLEPRVTTLEQAMFGLHDEMLAFKDEMRLFHDEMRTFKDEIHEETRVFKGQMLALQNAMVASSDRSDRLWGELANKMGKLVEDIVAPGIPEVFRAVFGQDEEPECSIRVRRRSRSDPRRRREFDVVAWGGGVFLVVETKSALAPEDIRRFVKVLGEARDFFPEAKRSKLVGALASFYVEPSLTRAGERKGLLMLGLSRGLLEVLNTPGFTPRAF